MTPLTRLVRQAQELLDATPTPDNCTDADQLTDEQLLALAGPGYPEFETWSERGDLPQTVAGLALVGGVIGRPARPEPSEGRRISDDEFEAIAREIRS